jgi:hypothetical protein
MVNMKVCILIALLVFFQASCFGQNESDARSFLLKLNVNYSRKYPTEGYSFGNLAPAIMIKSKRGIFHEVELNRLMVDRTVNEINNSQGQLVGGHDNRIFEAGVRYQFTWSATRGGKLRPQVGLSWLTSYTHNKTIPLSLNAYTRYTSRISETIDIVPQLRYNLYGEFFVDLGFPVRILSAGYLFQRIENPSIPLRNQKNGEYYIDYLTPRRSLQQLQIRFGIGLKI